MARVLGRTATFKKLVARSRNEVKQNFLWVNIRVGTFLVVSGVDDGVFLTFFTELDDAAGLLTALLAIANRAEDRSIQPHTYMRQKWLLSHM